MGIFDKYIRRPDTPDIENLDDAGTASGDELLDTLSEQLREAVQRVGISPEKLAEMIDEAIVDLEREGLIENVGGDKYRITDKGREMVDSIRTEVQKGKVLRPKKPSDLKLVNDP